MPTEEELFASVDALLREEPQLPPPAERARLREAAGVTQSRLAQALKTTLQTVKNWENGRSEPRPPRLVAYQRLLEGWAEKFPKPGTAAPAAVASPIPQPLTLPAQEQVATPPEAAAAPAPAPAAPVARQPEQAAARPASRPARKRAVPNAAAPYRHGPLAVLDGDGTAYGSDGIVLDARPRRSPNWRSGRCASPVSAPPGCTATGGTPTRSSC